VGQLDEVSLALGRIEAELRALRAELSAQQTVTADLTAMKNRAIGVLIGVSLLAGAVGAGVKRALMKVLGEL
jgi:hypothetical protein